MYLCTRKSPDGGIGRRAGLKHQWGNPSRFEPGSGGQPIPVRARVWVHGGATVLRLYLIESSFYGLSAVVGT